MLLPELTEISFEANVNKLYRNVFKTKLMLFGKNNWTVSNRGDTVLTLVKYLALRFLGVIIFLLTLLLGY